MNKKRLYLGVAAALLPLFLACEVMGPESGGNFGSDRKAAVRIAIEASDVQGRTVLPTVGLENVTAWELWGGKSPDPQTLLKDLSGTTETIYLETGTWDFIVKGYNSDGLILQGDLTGKPITLEGPNDLSFMVTPLIEGDGTFKITINLPAGHGITRAEVLKDGTKIDAITSVIDVVVFEDSYTVGDYYFSIRLYKNNDLYGVVSELAQVRANLLSEKTYTLTRGDLNLTYAIMYHVDGGSFDNGVENPAYYRSTDADVILPIPTWTGYDFGGWYDNAELTGTPVTVIPQSSLEDKDFYAQWNPETYTVNFKYNDGTDTTLYTKTVTVPATTIGAVNFPADPTRTGYTFTGWNTASTGSESPFTASTTVSSSMTVYAQWAETYTVIFKRNYGTDATLYTKTVTVPATTIGTANFPANPTRTGYTFMGWNTNPAGSGNGFNPITTVNGSITVYAQWVEIHTVIFKYNNGTNATLYTKTVITPATTIVDFPANPSWTGYNFGGWNTSSDGLGTAFTASTTVTGNITVYAKWDSYFYTVTFNNSGGDTEADPASKTVISPNTNVSTLPANPTRMGYVFDGWYIGAETGSVFTASTTVTGNITVYAKWTTKGLITLNPDAGDGAFSETDFTLSKSGSGNPTSQTISITGIGYNNPCWLVDGLLKGTENSITIQATDYGIGGRHTVSLLIGKNGVTWSKDIAFTVTN
jgi:uncharacterized repeat protein (TIGR02543 family)